jgi:hypothetical protein
MVDYKDEVWTHRVTKKFVDIYLKENPVAAGRFFLEHVMSAEETTPELEEFWKEAIKKEFDRQGYDLVKIED